MKFLFHSPLGHWKTSDVSNIELSTSADNEVKKKLFAIKLQIMFFFTSFVVELVTALGQYQGPVRDIFIFTLHWGNIVKPLHQHKSKLLIPQYLSSLVNIYVYSRG